MNITRTEILPGVWLSYLHSEKFKTACMSLTLLTQLQRETASMNALIPYVLRRGTTRYPDMEQLSGRMEELYGLAIEPAVRRIGEIQCLGFYASIPEEDFIPGKEKILHEACALLGQLLLSPVTRGGLLLPKYVDSEKEKLIDLIRSRINEKRSYAMHRCIEHMCCFEDYAVGRLGSESEAEAINYKKLTRQYRELLASSPVEIFYCGRSSKKSVISALKDALEVMPRGEINYDIGTDVRMNAVEDDIRYVEEELDVSQGKLVMGFRLGECMEEPDLASLYVFNAVYGSGVTSKLFVNVRERLQLCYYAGSVLDTHKGLMLVSSGIEFDKFTQARDEIFAQLENIKQGQVSEDELNWAKAGVASDLRSLMDSQGDLEGFYLSQTLDGCEYGPMELAELVDGVSLEEIQEIAAGIECDLVYFLKGSEEEEDADAED